MRKPDGGNSLKKFIENHESLEAFQNLEGQKYVAPILAHGGVPQYCLADFFTLLVRYGDPDHPSSDFIDSVREHGGSLGNIDKPVERFLFHGGEVAEEFVARCLALWLSHASGDGGGTHGLPKRVVEAFSKWYTEQAPAQRNRRRRLPKPQIKVAPGDLWVYMYLPRCDDHPDIGPNACWEANGREWAVSRDHTMPLNSGDDRVVRCNEREYILQGIHDSEPVMFFDPDTGKVIPDPSLRRLPEHLWAIFEQSLDVEPGSVYREAVPAWPGYVFAEFDLTGQQQVRFGGKQFEIRRPFFHVDQDPVVKGVTAEYGLPVYYGPPKIGWDGKANFSLTQDGNNEGNIDITSDEFQLWFDKPGHYEFYLRGALGQNVHKDFVMLPGISLDLQPEVMWPNIPKLKNVILLLTK